MVGERRNDTYVDESWRDQETGGGGGGGGDKWYDINFYSYRIRHDLITISFENRFGTIPDNRVLSNWIGGLHGAGGTERERERGGYSFL